MHVNREMLNDRSRGVRFDQVLSKIRSRSSDDALLAQRGMVPDDEAQLAVLPIL